MSFAHLLNETCYVEDPAFNADGTLRLRSDGGIEYSGNRRALKCHHLRRQRVFKTQGTTGDAGERISNHELVTSELIREDARVWRPGTDVNDVEQSLIPKEIEHQSRPTGGLILFHTFL